MCIKSRRLSKSVQRHLIEHFVAGTSARIAASFCGENHKNAAQFFHHLREIINFEFEQEFEAVFMAKLKQPRVSLAPIEKATEKVNATLVSCFAIVARALGGVTVLIPVFRPFQASWQGYTKINSVAFSG